MRRYIMLAMCQILWNALASAQIGNPFIHDPSTIMECEGKYYTFGTGGDGLIDRKSVV